MQCLVTWSSHRYFYPRPPRGGRLSINVAAQHRTNISIHALREEGDVVTVVEPHLNQRFLSTPSARRATLVFGVTVGICKFLSTPSARRATCSCSWGRRPRAISIHALREEGDMASVALIVRHMGFLSTPSARRATVGFKSPPSHQSHFYPRPPRGGRLASVALIVRHMGFLSTPSARRATCR